MKALLALPFVLAACSTEASLGRTTATQVALVPATVNNSLDLLFVIDDSPSAEALQADLQQAFPSFVQMLAASPEGKPNLHVGVVSTDLGTQSTLDPTPGTALGSGPGSCEGVGKDAVMQTSTLVTGAFISDVAAGDGSQMTNYSGTLAEAFASISSLGSSGCGFEQPLQAAERALTQPANAGFLRDDANLAVIVVSAEDDCSMARTSLLSWDTETLGPVQSFRCTRFGVTCDQGGETTSSMNQAGPKAGCRANESLAYLTSVRDTAAAIQALKPDRRTVMFGAIAGGSDSLEVEMRMPPGSATPIPALKHACLMPTNTALAIDPAVRIIDHARAYERSYVGDPCDSVGGALLGIARELRGMVGDACLTRDIAQPADCAAFDTFADGSEQPIARCTDATTADCWYLVEDPGCPGQQWRLHVTRSGPPAPDTMVSLRCKL